MIKLFIKSILLILMLSAFLFGSMEKEDETLAQLFTKRNIKGTIVISSLDGKIEYVYNRERAKQRFIPASTFKIPNTLIALEEGAISDEREVIKWDGVDKGFPVWNKDQTLQSAFPISCVWFYQELAKRVGNNKYLDQLKILNYGNKKTGPNVTTFWLDGDLKISALEQIRFLKKLYKEEFPYKKKHFQILKKIMVVDKKSEFILRAKTGWAIRIKKQYGWYVGYVETKNGIWFFATNIDIKKKSDAVYRRKITIDALRLLHIV